MKRALVAAAAVLVVAASALAQPGGRGMMGAPWGQDGFAMGPGMMGGYGPGYGMGPGMMGGFGMGYGMGPGMMGGNGPGGWGPAVADLSNDQRDRIAAIQREFGSKQFALMQQMHELGWRQGSTGGTFDEQAARKTYDAMAQLHKQMFENSLEAHKRLDAVLTPQQREQLRRAPAGR